MSYFLSRRKGFDIREKGSGNAGASNAMITMGWKAGILTALFDIGKAAFCVFAAKWLLGGVIPYVGAVAGVSAVLGHIFPFYLHFKGGKGLASFLGMTLGLNWQVFLAACAVIALVTLITDYIVYGTLATAVGVPIALGIMNHRPVLALIIFIATAVMVYKHKDNYKRLREGTEIGLLRANKGEDRVKPSKND
ncbi:MAG: glycerol-3-phosphate acyltransferase [Lachnospiraceae bacterium]|nr:glycerol-3-phosphate acyltransferase [Lachnospiraceae bacterium]MBQ6196120.1 glycerol-3-phosphate acyltransferase [Lachnospiraceae bacterium]